ncbi:hypothetical protein, partial [Streptomyces sp. NPDC056491]|uniref:hypothetical protein n=1 Tax=Streptomyces sp. NPDC056491 TaxID=3345837 RepID=UPI0036A815D8
MPRKNDTDTDTDTTAGTHTGTHRTRTSDRRRTLRREVPGTNAQHRHAAGYQRQRRGTHRTKDEPPNKHHH